METSTSRGWSELSYDILISLLERLSLEDFHRVKVVCRNWYLCSKQTVRPKSPWLMLSQEDGCVMLYHPYEDRVYKAKKRDFSRIRILGNSGNWFLVLDSESNLYIIDMFSEKRIDLPPLESIKGGRSSLERVGSEEFKEKLIGCKTCDIQKAEYLRGRLWVDEKKEDYIVVWYFDSDAKYIAFCKKGEENHYREIPTEFDVREELRGIDDILLRGDSLYVLTTRKYVRILDLCGRQEGFKDVSNNDTLISMHPPNLSHEEINKIMAEVNADVILSRYSFNIAVTTSGEVLLVHRIIIESSTPFGMRRIFRLYKNKKDPNLDLENELYSPQLIEVDSLGDEALLLDLGITVPADHNLGIEPNSIYFARIDRIFHDEDLCLDIYVFNLATKTIKRFPTLSNLKFMDARWFLPS